MGHSFFGKENQKPMTFRERQEMCARRRPLCPKVRKTNGHLSTNVGAKLALIAQSRAFSIANIFPYCHVTSFVSI